MVEGDIGHVAMIFESDPCHSIVLVDEAAAMMTGLNDTNLWLAHKAETGMAWCKSGGRQHTLDATTG